VFVVRRKVNKYGCEREVNKYGCEREVNKYGCEIYWLQKVSGQDLHGKQDFIL